MAHADAEASPFTGRDDMDAVEREVTVPTTPDEVWPAMTTPGEISAWFGADAEIDVRPGGRGVFRWPDGTERHVVVEAAEPGHRLCFRWLPFQRMASGEMVTLPSTRVEITLDEVPGGTRVRVVERAPFSLGAGRPRASTRLLAAIGW
jgi:uncharacterized protein YndB with AHSA1/START domain